MDDEVFRQITRVREYFADTKNYYLLLRHAKFMASRYIWFGSRSQSMPKANLPEDVVHELVEQVLDEDINSKTRRKLPEDIEIGKALRMQIRSKLSALSESRDNRTVRRETDLVRDTDDIDVVVHTAFLCLVPSTEHGRAAWMSPVLRVRVVKTEFHAFLSATRLQLGKRVALEGGGIINIYSTQSNT